ncbi:MAG: sigma-70 family RNA polymerase sigma factor [Clostridia bacterium]|nr:sigma-70 family RNA polymerase sigma factor [Clostridia bacterium]
MTDREMIGLFFDRDERALKELADKYGAYCYAVAYRILNSDPDADECVNDAYYAVWNRIPPEKPKDLGAFVSRITRNIAVSRVRAETADKRGGNESDTLFGDFDECCESAESEVIASELAAAVNRFIKRLSKRSRDIFLCRYYYYYPTSEIAKHFDCSEVYVRKSLSRTRQKLKEYLIREKFL